MAVVQSSGTSNPSTITPYAPLTAVDLEAIINQALTRREIVSSSVLFASPGSSSWLIDSSCFNHMTSNTTFFTFKIPLSYPSLIHTTYGSSLEPNHIGTVSTPNFTIKNTYFVPNLLFNLLFVG